MSEALQSVSGAEDARLRQELMDTQEKLKQLIKDYEGQVEKKQNAIQLHVQTIEKSKLLRTQLIESNGCLKLLSRNCHPERIQILNEVIDRNTTALEQSKKVLDPRVDP